MSRVEKQVSEYDRIEAEIKKLHDEAQPLRALADDDPKKAKLTKIVDEINQLRAKQTTAMRDEPDKPAPMPKTDIVGDDGAGGVLAAGSATIRGTATVVAKGAKIDDIDIDAGNAKVEGSDAKK